MARKLENVAREKSVISAEVETRTPRLREIPSHQESRSNPKCREKMAREKLVEPRDRARGTSSVSAACSADIFSADLLRQMPRQTVCFPGRRTGLPSVSKEPAVRMRNLVLTFGRILTHLEKAAEFISGTFTKHYPSGGDLRKTQVPAARFTSLSARHERAK